MICAITELMSNNQSEVFCVCGEYDILYQPNQDYNRE